MKSYTEKRKYNFDEIVPRRNTNSLKWDAAEDGKVIPMWVADMDFRTAPAITNAIIRRAKHGIYGYSKIPAAYYDAVIGWFERRHHFMIQKDWILYTTGVVPAISAVIKALTVPGDQVIIQTPVYNCFFSSIRNNLCEIVSNELIYKDKIYSIDFDDLERKASSPKAKVLLLCSPHNPVGRVWTKEELTRIGEICLRNQVIVISDEIHCDLVFSKHKHIPFASIREDFLQNSVTCTAPSKTFNLAGLQCANIIAADEIIRQKINKALNVNETCEINIFAVESLIAAYNKGEEWLNELNQYLYDNYIYLLTFIRHYIPSISVIPLEATYLAWLDISATGLSSRVFAKTLLEEKKLWINEGTLYGANGENFIRMNFACPRQLLMEGLTILNVVLNNETATSRKRNLNEF